MALPDGGAAVFAVATRITPLDEDGAPDVGRGVYTTDTLIEATFQPTNESGDDIAVKNAAGNLAVYTRHGDMPKYYAVTIELAIPDPNLESLLTNGVVYSDSSAALGETEPPSLEGSETGGSLAAGTYSYQSSDYNQYGETAASAETSVTIAAGTKGEVIVTPVIAAKALGARIYGRVSGDELFIGVVPNIGKPEAGEVKKGAGKTIIPLEVALTKPVPAGTTVTISSDPTKPKTVFTLSEVAGVGATLLHVVAANPVADIPAKGIVEAVFVDTGAVTPEGKTKSSDTTAGAGSGIGFQAPALGSVSNEHGVSIEFYEKVIVGGTQATYLPYWRILLPACRNFVVEQRDVKNANLGSKFTGQAFQNPNWGSGPFGDWQFDSSKVVQRARCSSQVLPKPSLEPTPASY